MALKPLINHTEETKAIFDLISDPGISAYFGFSDFEKSVLQLRLQNDRSFRQIANALGSPVFNVELNYTTALTKVKNKLAAIFERFKSAAGYIEEIEQLRKEISELKENNISEIKSFDPPIDPTILSIQVKDLELENWVLIRLRDRGILTVGELMNWSTSDLLKFRTMGAKTIEAIQTALAKHGLKLDEK